MPNQNRDRRVDKMYYVWFSKKRQEVRVRDLLRLAVADVAALDHVNGQFCNIGRMVGDSLKIPDN